MVATGGISNTLRVEAGRGIWGESGNGSETLVDVESVFELVVVIVDEFVDEFVVSNELEDPSLRLAGNGVTVGIVLDSEQYGVVLVA